MLLSLSRMLMPFFWSLQGGNLASGQNFRAVLNLYHFFFAPYFLLTCLLDLCSLSAFPQVDFLRPHSYKICALLVNHLQRRPDQRGLEIRLGELANDEHMTIHHDRPLGENLCRCYILRVSYELAREFKSAVCCLCLCIFLSSNECFSVFLQTAF